VNKPRGARLLSLIAAVFALLVVIWPTAPASAHSELEESTPAAGATLTKAPALITLTFSEPVQDGGSSIVVSVRDTIVSKANTFATNENVATVQLAPSSQPGTYKVDFRVVSADGHIVSDSFSYDVERAGSSYSSSPEASGSPIVSSTPLAGDESDDAGGTVVWVLGAGAIGLALVAAIIAVAMRGRRDHSS
jgi:methionine-rich copper-binding protein CopC